MAGYSRRESGDGCIATQLGGARRDLRRPTRAAVCEGSPLPTGTKQSAGVARWRKAQRPAAQHPWLSASGPQFRLGIADAGFRRPAEERMLLPGNGPQGAIWTESTAGRRSGLLRTAGDVSIFHVPAALVELAGDEVDLRVSQYCSCFREVFRKPLRLHDALRTVDLVDHIPSGQRQHWSGFDSDARPLEKPFLKPF